jgi:dihydroorotase
MNTEKRTKGLLLKGGRIVDPATGRDEVADLLIEAGRVKDVGKLSAAVDSDRCEMIDVTGLVVAPGLIDMHVHLREPGREDEETIESGSHAAVKGGLTAVVPMANTNPPTDDQTAVRFVRERGREVGLTRILPVAAVTKQQEGKELTEIAELVDAGAVAISDDGVPVRSAELMRRALEYAKMFGIPVISHAEDPDLSADGQMHEGLVSTSLGLHGIPAAAEESMVSRDLILARLTGSHVHIAHVSTKGSVELIRGAKAQGVRVTAETAPHYCTLTDESIAETFDTNLKVNPPLRTQEDVQAVIKGLVDGTLDVIASDHAPHSIAEKEVEFPAAPCGMIGMETMLGIVLTKLVHGGHLSLSQALARLSLGPASALGIEGGTLEPGSPAHLTIIDLGKEWVVDPSTFASKSRNCPFTGWRLTGLPMLTIVDGRVVYTSPDREARGQRAKARASAKNR